MEPWIAYLLKVNVALVVFYLFYRLLFYRDTFFVTRRLTLWSMLGLAFVYPLISFSGWLLKEEPLQETLVRYGMQLQYMVEPADRPGVSLNGPLPVLTYLYVFIVSVLLVRIFLQLWSILRLGRKGIRSREQKYVLVRLPGSKVPFSFFKFIFIDPLKYDPEVFREIMIHEETHVRQWHSLDVLVGELLCAFFWINPAMWLIKREIRRNLEFLADKEVLGSGCNRKDYQYHLLYLTHPSAAASIVNKFNVSPLKKRIMMMNKKQTGRSAVMKYVLLLPLTLMLVLSENVSAVTGLFGTSAGDRDKVCGQVLDEIGNNLSGAIVILEGTNIGTNSGKDGRFTLVLPENAPESGYLVISHIGKKNLRISFRDAATKPIRMEKEIAVMKEYTVKGRPQPQEGEISPSDGEEVFVVVEDMPRFWGGEKGLVDFLSTNLRYPASLQEQNVQGRVVVVFTVNEKGEITNSRIEKGVHPELDQEALRIIRMMPSWKPGMQRGKKVAVECHLPIDFVLPK